MIMKMKHTIKIAYTLVPLTLTSINASNELANNAEALFREACNYYLKHLPTEDQRTLGRIEIKLKRVIEAKDVSEKILAQCGNLFMSLGCYTSYLNTLSRMHLPSYSEFCYTEAQRLFDKTLQL
jgi:hypothetical protein